MAATVLEQARALRTALAAFDPATLTGEDAATVAEALAATEKACAVARARTAARAAECHSHERRGFADAAEWLARLSGCTRGDAKAALDTASTVSAGTPVGAALAAGELSIAQAAVISRAESECPGSEAEMLALARGSSLAKLHDEARRRRLAAADPEELHRRQHHAREFRHWRDAEGMVRLAGALPPEVGVRLMNRLDDECDRIRRAAIEPEPRAAHAADALVALLAGTVATKRSSTELVLVCDLNAYRRGHAHHGEPCHIVGGGPVPVEVLRRLAEDAFLKVVLHDGVRIDTVAHVGRHIRAELRTALELGPPPDFDGVVCAESGCDRRYGLEWDHVDPVANGGLTSFENLRARCWPHHRAKTQRDRQAGLCGPSP
ncbi:MAG TPA: DUF222 domain-containing protein [Acidimicrobiales bacterium]